MWILDVIWYGFFNLISKLFFWLLLWPTKWKMWPLAIVGLCDRWREKTDTVTSGYFLIDLDCNSIFLSQRTTSSSKVNLGYYKYYSYYYPDWNSHHTYFNIFSFHFFLFLFFLSFSSQGKLTQFIRYYHHHHHLTRSQWFYNIFLSCMFN